nr:peptidoglycan DD-metalloendopeptidase family protein [uncultured Aquabacterium sp.]
MTQAIQSSRLSPIVAAARALQAAAHRHPRRISAAVLAVLAGSAMTAFGVAPLSALPDSATPLVTQVTEAIEPAALPAQLQGLDLQSMRLYRSDVTRSADTADSLLKRLGVDDAQAAQFIRNDPLAATLLQGRLGKSVKAVVDQGRLLELVVRGPADTSADIDTHFTRLTLSRLPQGGFSVDRAVLPLERLPQMGSATIQSSLYAAADDARIPDAVTNQIAEIFGNDIDFRRELRKGDAFSVLYEAHLADGEPVTWGNHAGRVLAARFINQGEEHNAVWFQEAGRKGSYFDLTGRSKVRAFLSSPLAFSRVTSGFAMRFHPIHRTWRAHLGVDFGAPTGTPVRTVGEGQVSFSGWQNGYGNVVHVLHSGNRTTVYAHLHRIDVRRGERVEQGQRIGTVGSTGWATGPHLHFEFKMGNQQVDPMKIARESETLQLSPTALAQFRNLAVDVAQRLRTASEWQAAGAQSGPRFE